MTKMKMLGLLFTLCVGLTPLTSTGQERIVSAPGFDATPVKIDPVRRSAPRPITSMELLTIRDLKGMQISPDGKSVAYVVVEAVYETNSYRSALFVVGTDHDSLPVNLGTAGPPSFDPIGQLRNYTLAWSPDSRYITCLVKRIGSWQIWRWRRDGGKPEQLTHSSADVQEYEWSSDGSKIIFTTSEPVDPGSAKKALETGIIYDGSIRGWGHDTFPRLALETKPKKKQTSIYEIGNRTERRVTAEEEAKYRKPILPEMGPGQFILNSKLSRDGTLQVFTVAAANGYSIFVKPIGGGKALQILPPSARYILDLWWSKDASEIYFEQDGPPRHALYAISATGGGIRGVSKGEDLLWAFSFDQDQSLGACIRTNPTLPGQVALLDLKTGLPRTLVDINPEFQNIALSPATRLEWKNKYGIGTHGHLVKPLNYVPGQRYPLIVTTYASGGFLRGNAGDEYPIQVFAANGFAVLDFNEPPRINVQDGDFKKTMTIWDSPKESLATVIKMLDEMGIVQSDKKALTGLSFGAEITAYTISHSDLFQAAATSGGGGHDPSFYDLAETYWQKRLAQWGLGGRPEGEAAARWRQLSAALNAEQINAPLLIQISDSELLPSLMLYNSLKELKKPVEMVVYADEGHVKNQPKHRYEIYQRNLDWFKFWLQDKEDPDPAKAEQYKRWRELKKLQEKSAASAPSPSN